MAKAPSSKPADGGGIQVVTRNKRAGFDYSIEEKLEAGLALLGSEVKSLRSGAAQLKDSYAVPKGSELYLLNAHIGPYDPASSFSHQPTRTRKLLLHRAEIDRWAAKVKERGYSIIPLMLYFKNGRAKVELALCRGKTHGDRRADIKEREMNREIDRALHRR